MTIFCTISAIRIPSKTPTASNRLAVQLSRNVRQCVRSQLVDFSDGKTWEDGKMMGNPQTQWRFDSCRMVPPSYK